MHTVIKKINLYSYDELSDKAKEKVKHDWLISQDNMDLINDWIKEGVFTSLGLNDAAYEADWFSQGSGVNVYGTFYIESILRFLYKASTEANRTLETCYDTCCNIVYALKKQGYNTAEEARNAFIAHNAPNDYTPAIHIPYHRDHYTYSLAQTDTECIDYFSKTNIEEEMQEICHNLTGDADFFQNFMNNVKSAFTALNQDIYDATSAMLLDITDYDMSGHAYDTEFTSDGNPYHITDETPAPTGASNSKKSWTDAVTNDLLTEFLNKELDPEEIATIRRHKKTDEIVCHITTLWESDNPEDIYDGQEGVFPITDEIEITPDHIEADFDTQGLDTKWKYFQIAKGIHPMQLNNPYA